MEAQVAALKADPFAQLSQEGATLQCTDEDWGRWRPVLPVPPNAPREWPTHALGRPSAVWGYLDADGRALHVTCRWDTPNGKTVMPLCWCRHVDGREGWRWQAPPTPRPIYGLNRLSARPEAPVIVVEGEKVADAGGEFFSDHVAITSSGGSNAAAKADWSPLAGRRVIIWPDNDAPGLKYADDVARLALEAGADDVRQARPPHGLPQGWDLADPVPEKIDLRSILDTAEPVPEMTLKPQGVTLLSASDIRPEPVRWLWRNWLAQGKVHILAGAPGTGKTTIALAFGATISTAGRWPDRTQAVAGDVLVWSGEDDPADTIVPRLVACRADLQRVHIVGHTREGGEDRPFDPSTDMAMLADACRKVPDLRLVIVDPVVSAIRGDSNKNADVRRGLQPLVDFAASTGAGVLGITHFSKGTAGRDPTERVTGSVAFGAVARVVLVTAKADDGTRRLVRAKSNIGPDGEGVVYGLPQLAAGDLNAQAAHWGDMLHGSATSLLGEAEGSDGPRSAIAEAEDFLRDLLTDGPIEAKTVRTETEDAGYSWATVRRAKDNLKVQVAKSGLGGTWRWSLPAIGSTCSFRPQDAQGAQTPDMSTLSILRENEHLGPDLAASSRTRVGADDSANNIDVAKDFLSIGEAYAYEEEI